MLCLISGLVVLSVAVFSPAAGQPRCDIECPRYPNTTCIDGNLPNPVDCGSFCQCTNCVPYLSTCPPGTHYNPATDSCINIEQSTCVVSTAPLPTTTTPPPRANLTTLAVNLYEKFGVQNPLIYDNIVLNRGGHLETISNRATIPEIGVYLIALNVGAGGSTQVDFRFQEEFLGEWFGIRRASTSHPSFDTLSKNFIVTIDGGQRVWTSTHSDRIYSDPKGLQTSWGMFTLTGEMGITNAFGVGAEAPYGPGILQFDTILANEGGTWEPSTNRFIAPVSGVYYFMYSVGVAAGVRVHTSLAVDGFDMSVITRTDTTHNDVDTLSQAMFLELRAGETVQLNSNYSGYSDYLLLTSFSGFLYNPAHGQSVAWGAYRTSSWEDTGGGLNPIPFDTIAVNKGFAWNSNEAICSVGGVYYVHVSAGAMSQQPVEVTLVKSGEAMATLTRGGIAHTGVDTLSRSMMIECELGETMWLEASSGTALYSDQGFQTGFSGFLMYPL